MIDLTHGDLERLIWFIDSSLPEYEAQGIYYDVVAHIKSIKEKLEEALP
jgi:hypothetical protein